MLRTQFRKNFTSTFTALKQLNPGKLKGLKAGDQLKVPNVQPFQLASVKDIQPGSETALQAANEVEDQLETQASTPAASGAPRNVSAKVDTRTKEMLQHGQRSGNFYMFAPGPRNPVGVMWIALNKKASVFTEPMIRVRSDTL